MAADDSITSPASYVQRTFSESGNRASEAPVSGGVPRNCAQRSAGAWSGASTRPAGIATASSSVIPAAAKPAANSEGTFSITFYFVDDVALVPARANS